MKQLVGSLVLVAALCAGAAINAQQGGTDAESSSTEGAEIVFRHALDGKPLDMNFRPDQQITPAVEEFHRTAENPYSGDEQAIAKGKPLYERLCAACHLRDGTGRIGPNLVDDHVKYPQVATDKGMFEVIYGGAAGAMQAFGRRIDQDQILKVMAYLETLGASD